jgi:ubiquitin carboxyl-terminal hydrolase 5/13
MEMGFTENAAKKATLLTKNEGLETATNWIMQHLEDSDLNEPHSSFKKELSTVAVNEKIVQLTNLGFSNYQAKYALKQTNYDTNVAAEWLFNYSDEIPPESSLTQEGLFLFFEKNFYF